MPKIITSPVDKFPGTVTLHDPLYGPQVLPFERALNAVSKREEGDTISDGDLLMLSGVLPCVEKWDIQGVPDEPTADTFPMTPKRAASNLIRWVFDEVCKIYAGEEDADSKND